MRKPFIQDERFTTAVGSRDVQITDGPSVSKSGHGRNLISVIGIDSYHHSQRWQPLANAVSDAHGAAALFEGLGFEQALPALLNEAATKEAIHSLVTDDLTTLGPEDNLVLFYAGHGGSRSYRVGTHDVMTGYLIPVDAEDRVASWVELEAWLRAVALLPARHILVILDACHSGIALNPVRWRDGSPHNEPLATLRARRSRRIVTSALGGQRAMDGGPSQGHSLFTGYLIEALTHGLRRNDETVATGTELGLYVQQRVRTHSSSQQTPDFGAFHLDDRGEMVLPLVSNYAELPSKHSSATLPISAGQRRSDLNEDALDSGNLVASGARPNGPDHHDRTAFWANVERLLDPPTTIRGARTKRFQSFRHGAFAGNVRLGVVANDDGAMRVHLWSVHRDHQQTLQSIEREARADLIAVPSELGPLMLRPAPKGEMLYLEFAWHRNGPYLRELDRIRASIQWFVDVVRHRFK